MKLFRVEFWLFWLGIILFICSLIGSFTPIVWEWEGRPPEQYPEYVFLGFGLPLAIIVIIFGGFSGMARLRGSRIFRREFMMMWGGLALAFVSLFEPWVFPTTMVGLQPVSFFIGIPVGLVLVILGSVLGAERQVEAKARNTP